MGCFLEWAEGGERGQRQRRRSFVMAFAALAAHTIPTPGTFNPHIPPAHLHTGQGTCLIASQPARAFLLSLPPKPLASPPSQRSFPPFARRFYRPKHQHTTTMLRTVSTTLLRHGRVTGLGMRPFSSLIRPASVTGLLPALQASSSSSQVSLPQALPFSPYACARLTA